MLVGSYLVVHFTVYGVPTGLGLRWLHHRRTGRGREQGRGIAALALAVLTATVYVAGVMALVLDRYFTSFAITAPRVPILLTMFAGTAAFFLADEWLTRGAGAPRIAQPVTRAAFLGSLGISVASSFEALFFLLIIAAMILLCFLIHGLFGAWIYRATGHPAVGALANAADFAWALTVVFPMLAS